MCSFPPFRYNNYFLQTCKKYFVNPIGQHVHLQQSISSRMVSIIFRIFVDHVKKLLCLFFVRSVYKGNILEFSAVQKEHRGTYYCVATNVVSVGARRNVDVEVEFAPSIKVVRKRVGQALQFDADLECHIEAYPPPAIKWYRDNILLSTNQV